LADKIEIKFAPTELILLAYVGFQAVKSSLAGISQSGYILLFYVVAALFIGAMALVQHDGQPSLRSFLKLNYPLFMLFLFYHVAGIQTAIIGGNIYDSLFNSLEKSLVGVYPSFALQRIMEVWLNELSYFGYAIGVIMPSLAFLMLFRKGRLNIYENYIMAIALGCCICLGLAVSFPTLGPEEALSGYYYLGFWGYHFTTYVPLFVRLFTSGQSSFPAFYFCVIIISSFYLWDYGRFYVVLSLLVMGLVFWGGVYLRYHYLLDGVVALIIAIFASASASYSLYRSSAKRPDFT